MTYSCFTAAGCPRAPMSGRTWSCGLQRTQQGQTSALFSLPPHPPVSAHPQHGGQQGGAAGWGSAELPSGAVKGTWSCISGLQKLTLTCLEDVFTALAESFHNPLEEACTGVFLYRRSEETVATADTEQGAEA